MASFAVLFNPRALKPRSAVPAIALVLSLVLVAVYGYIVIQLAGLGRMH